jgi:hypothetical protein
MDLRSQRIAPCLQVLANETMAAAESLMSQSGNSKPSGPRRAGLEVAAAVAREAVIELHVERALDLIRLAERSVGALRMLDIYIRLLTLSGTTREVVANRALAALGAEAGEATPSLASADDDVEPSMWRLLRRRLRGRVHDDLRYAVELHTGVTHAALLELHVEHARRFVEQVGDRQRLNDACLLYIHMVSAPLSLRPILYPLVLARISAGDTRTPAAAAEPGAVLAAAWPRNPPARSPLRSQQSRQPA